MILSVSISAPIEIWDSDLYFLTCSTTSSVRFIAERRFCLSAFVSLAVRGCGNCVLWIEETSVLKYSW